MQDLNIALLQTDQYWEDKQKNLSHFEQKLSNLHCDLLLLPEMFQTGFTMNASEMAEDFSDSKSITWLKKIAKEKNTAIYTSLIIRENSQFFNRGVFVKPTGEIIHYDKRKTFSLAKEDQYYESGKEERIVEYLGWKINLQICYDLRFPELSRNSIEKSGNSKYDLLLYVANWPERRIPHWDALLKARAIENQCYIAAVNRVGEDENGLSYNGHSTIIDPYGNILSYSDKEELCYCVINSTSIGDIREKLPFLRDI